MKLNTINVIEIMDEYNVTVQSFPDTKAGNKEAEDLFSRIVLENDGTVGVEIDDFISDGIYEDNGYKVMLVHSS